ncbi:MAG TPA: hypothetical protein VL728_18345 [Cyclobacteriaceae bacterium]|jgi:hypothetical protein|nr:hypothetical protein [Cyclobacteriaceae bacterium]
MEEKVSTKAIDQYSNLFASKLADPFFHENEKINGKEILSFCGIKQVNLFVLKQLMTMWNVESEKWRSPFFDYESAEVREAVAQFKNVLSNNISISKKDFVPLLKTAVSQTLFLILAPYDFYANILDQKKGLVRVEELKNETRYLKINQKPLEKLVEKLELRKADIIMGNEAFGMLDHILEEVNFTPEDFEGHVAAFSQVVPLQIEGLFELKESKTQEQKPQPQPKPTTVASNNKDQHGPAIEKKSEFRIKDSLTINQKFMFTKMLFSGDFEIFTEAIERLDNLDSLKQVTNYINDNYPHWDRESEEFEEFMAVVQRKFL